MFLAVQTLQLVTMILQLLQMTALVLSMTNVEFVVEQVFQLEIVTVTATF